LVGASPHFENLAIFKTPQDIFSQKMTGEIFLRTVQFALASAARV